MNGNHFEARQQIVIIHPEKSLEHKQELLTDVQLMLVANDGGAVPESLRALATSIPILPLDDDAALFGFFEQYLALQSPALN